MGFVHNSNYLMYFEEARTDLVRKENYPYKRIEDEGIILPISDARIEYKNPLKYDDEFNVKTSLEYVKNMSMKFQYIIKKSNGTIICKGYTIHPSLNSKTNDFEFLPKELTNKLKKYVINNKKTYK